jgi:site-specific DNA-methyltransferase (adenine-specific)
VLELNKVYFEDCLTGMRKIDDKSIDLICCDLPFGSTSNKWDTIIPFDKMWEQYLRIIKDNCGILLFGTGLFSYKLALSNEKWFKYDLIWQKSKCGSPLNAKYKPMAKHEHILVFGDGRINYYPQMLEGTPYKRTGVNIKTNNHKYGLKQVTTENFGTRHPSTILDFPQKWRRQDQIHPTQKPVELLEWLIKSYSKEGDIVLDNCSGGGSTLIAAKNLKRNFIGFETNEEYYKITCERIKPLPL